MRIYTMIGLLCLICGPVQSIHRHPSQQLTELGIKNIVASYMIKNDDICNLKIAKCGHVTSICHSGKKWPCIICNKRIRRSELIEIPKEIMEILNITRIFMAQSKEIGQPVMSESQNTEKIELTLSEIAKRTSIEERERRKNLYIKSLLSRIPITVMTASKAGKNEVQVTNITRSETWWNDLKDIEQLCAQLSESAGIKIFVSNNYMSFGRLEKAEISARW